MICCVHSFSICNIHIDIHIIVTSLKVMKLIIEFLVYFSLNLKCCVSLTGPDPAKVEAGTQSLMFILGTFPVSSQKNQTFSMPLNTYMNAYLAYFINIYHSFLTLSYSNLKILIIFNIGLKKKKPLKYSTLDNVH